MKYLFFSSSVFVTHNLTTICHLLRFIYSTCFNRLDLPLYKTKRELQEKLKISVTVAAVGFDME